MTTFNVYRRESNDTNPPVAIATGLTSMSYSDVTAVAGTTYLYSVGAVKSGFEEISAEVSILAGGDVYIDFVEFIIRQSDPTKNVSRDFKDVSPKNLTITGVGNPLILNPLHKSPCVVIENYAKFSTSIPALGVSDFTIELDFASIGGGIANGRMLSITNSGETGSIIINKNSTEISGISVMINNGGWNTIISSAQTISSVFKRIILQRKNGIFYLFFDGDLVGQSSAYAGFSITNTSFFYNGWHTTGDYANGVFGECRITNGIARYPTQDFELNQSISMSTEIDEYRSNVILLATPTQNSLIDVSSYSRSMVSHGTPSFSGLQVQNEPILLFYTESSHIRASIPNIETSDLTLEFNYYYYGSSQPYPRIGQFGFSDQINGSCVFNTTSPTSMIIYFWVSGAYSQTINISFENTANQPVHFCFMRKNGEFYVFINGVLKGQGVGSVFKNFNLNTSLMLGTGANSDTRSRVAMHGVRFTRYARYPTSGFDRPTESFFTQ